MDQYLKRHKQPKLIQGEIDYLKSPVSIKENESIMNNLIEKNIQGPDCFTYEFLPNNTVTKQWRRK